MFKLIKKKKEASIIENMLVTLLMTIIKMVVKNIKNAAECELS